MSLILNLLLLSVVIYFVSRILPGVHLKSFGSSIWVAVVYSLINILVGWLIKALALPITILTLGLFILVINAFLLWLTDRIIADFKIDGLGWTFLAALLITAGNWILTSIFSF